MTLLFVTPARVPIPANGVDYRGKVVLAPMVRSGELPSRLLALKYGADLVWGPETIDRSMIGAIRRINPRNATIEFTRQPSNGGRTGKAPSESIIYRIDPVREKGKLIFHQIGTASPELAVQAAKVVPGDVVGIDLPPVLGQIALQVEHMAGAGGRDQDAPETGVGGDRAAVGVAEADEGVFAGQDQPVRIEGHRIS